MTTSEIGLKLFMFIFVVLPVILAGTLAIIITTLICPTLLFKNKH